MVRIVDVISNLNDPWRIRNVVLLLKQLGHVVFIVHVVFVFLLKLLEMRLGVGLGEERSQRSELM
jgi:hypothetical protein